MPNQEDKTSLSPALEADFCQRHYGDTRCSVLDQVRAWDSGHWNYAPAQASGTWQPLIPDGRLIVFGHGDEFRQPRRWRARLAVDLLRQRIADADLAGSPS